MTQNGWIPKTPKSVIEAYVRRIFNQHNGPPEQFGGKGMRGRAVHCAMLEFQRLASRTFDTSVVAHHVETALDTGAVVKRMKVSVFKEDSVDQLRERAFPWEHRVQIAMLQDFVRGEIQELESELLVHPDELHLLEQAIKIAVERYPRG